MTNKATTTVRSKLVRVVLLTLAFVAVATGSSVSWTQFRSSEQNLATIEASIREGITSKGTLLSENHALALRALVADNAFGDVDKLVSRAVREDSDVLYGTFVGEDMTPWVLATPDHPPPKEGDKGKKKRPKEEDLKGIAFPEDGPPQDKSSSREQALFGQTVLEFSTPVTEDDELLGWIVYGISTKRMDAALGLAREESIDQLIQTLSIIAGMLVLTFVMGFLLAGREASRITRPLGSLTGAAKKIASGDKGVRVSINSGDEIEVLSGAFNQMVGDLEKSYQELEGLNASLEDKVKERTAELAVRNRDMRMVLDTVEQGFITIDADANMAQERSAVVDKWLGSYDDKPRFDEYIARFDAGFGDWFELGWGMVKEDLMPMEMCFEQLPQRMSIEGRELEFSYSPILNGEQVQGALISIADITSRLAHEKAEAEQREIVRIFQRAVKDRTGYLDFHRDADRMVKQICGTEAVEPVLLKRIIHTLKGNSGLIGLEVIAHICHEMETEMADKELEQASDSAKEALRARWTELDDTFTTMFGESDKAMQVDTAEYEQVLAAAKQRAPHDVLVRTLNNWRLEPVEKAFARMGEQAKTLAQRLGKGEIEVKIEGNELRLEPERWGPLWTEMTHVIRNAIDHGLEDPDERAQTGKTDPASILFRAKQERGRIEIDVGDNGRGVNWEAVANKAKSMNLPHEKHEDLVAALFEDSMSTREQATEVSGRGVGMSAVKATCEEMGGQIAVISKTGSGTTFRFTFPQDQVVTTLKVPPPPRLASA